jgi:hypothetical protein
MHFRNEADESEGVGVNERVDAKYKKKCFKWENIDRILQRGISHADNEVLFFAHCLHDAGNLEPCARQLRRASPV